VEKIISFRRATIEDAELLFSWANDIDVRRNAFSQQEILWDEHIEWFQKKLKDDKCVIYIACADEKTERPVGQLRLDIDGEEAEIDYSVCAEMRGYGYGTAMVEKVCTMGEAGIKKLTAKVKNTNPFSARVFEKCGFVKTAEHEDYIELEYLRSAQDIAKKRKIVICTQKSWNIENAKSFAEKNKDFYETTVITSKEELRAEFLSEINPEFVFFPHWSYLIPESIFGTWNCVVFHMTDLPFGRGGSPLQNLIVRGMKETKLSAIRVEAGLDTGDVYLKEDLDLSGTADQILRRASGIIFSKMIPTLLEKNPVPVPQSGEVVSFQRRKPEDGCLLPDMSPETIYDYIRMLDGEGYPPAFLEMGDYRLTFTEAEIADGEVIAKVRFERKIQE